MKLLKAALITGLLGLGTVQTSQAAIASIAFMGGAFGVAAQYGLVGLGWAYVGNKIQGRNETLGYIALVSGLIILDENSGKVEFSKVSKEQAILKGLTHTELESYNAEIEEVNIVFSEVTSQVNQDMDKTDLEALWQDHSDFLSSETFTALKKIVK